MRVVAGRWVGRREGRDAMRCNQPTLSATPITYSTSFQDFDIHCAQQSFIVHNVSDKRIRSNAYHNQNAHRLPSQILHVLRATPLTTHSRCSIVRSTLLPPCTWLKMLLKRFLPHVHHVLQSLHDAIPLTPKHATPLLLARRQPPHSNSLKHAQ